MDEVDAEGRELPWLDWVATGGQSHVFGRERWVVKVARVSWRTVLGRVLVHPDTPLQAMDVLGGWVEPIVMLDRVKFAGPEVVGGRARVGSVRRWSARRAVAVARLAADDFLDRRMAEAMPDEAAELMLGLLGTLDAIRARGWHVLDFIMSNFVVGAGGRVRLVDAGMLIPESHLGGPSQQISSRMFVRRLAADYGAVLAGVADRHPDDRLGRGRLAAVAGDLPLRLERWRAGRVGGRSSDSAAAVFSPELREEIGRTLLGGGGILPLTLRQSSGYTATHHAITSEN